MSTSQAPPSQTRCQACTPGVTCASNSCSSDLHRLHGRALLQTWIEVSRASTSYTGLQVFCRMSRHMFPSAYTAKEARLQVTANFAAAFTAQKQSLMGVKSTGAGSISSCSRKPYHLGGRGLTEI